MSKSFAVLLTCFNRKDKTLLALDHLYKAYENGPKKFSLAIYLTDDGSTDGTSETVSEKFPEVKLLKGDGSLFWAGGMRNSWNEAKKKDFDAYLLLNDDTNVTDDLFDKIHETESYCTKKYGISGIYIGATSELGSNKATYGGSVFTNRFLGTAKRCPINNEKPQECELGNANIMWVSKKVFDTIGMLSEGYVHGMADFDYTMRAVKKNLPVLIMPGISGYCINDHGNTYEHFIKLNFKERIEFLNHPTGLDFKSQSFHMRRHFPLRYPLFYVTGWLKVLFPKQYYKRLYVTRVRPIESTVTTE